MMIYYVTLTEDRRNSIKNKHLKIDLKIMVIYSRWFYTDEFRLIQLIQVNFHGSFKSSEILKTNSFR